MMFVPKVLSRGLVALVAAAVPFAVGQGVAGAATSDQGTATITFQTNSTPVKSVTCHIYGRATHNDDNTSGAYLSTTSDPNCSANLSLMGTYTGDEGQEHKFQGSATGNDVETVVDHVSGNVHVDFTATFNNCKGSSSTCFLEVHANPK